MRNYGGQAMNRIYETKDAQYIVLAGSEAKFSENLLKALGRLDFLDIAKGEPGQAQKPLTDFFTETFKSKTRAEWEAFLEPIDLCWAPVRSLKDGFEDHQQRRARRCCCATGGATRTSAPRSNSKMIPRSRISICLITVKQIQWNG